MVKKTVSTFWHNNGNVIQNEIMNQFKINNMIAVFEQFQHRNYTNSIQNQ